MAIGESDAAILSRPFLLSNGLPASPTYRSLLDTAPFVRDELLAGGVSIDGSTQSDSTIFIDGQEVTNPVSGALNANYDLPWPLLQEVSLISRESSARFAGSIGGSINVVTRGGTKDWHGDFGFSFSPEGLNGGTRPVLNRYGTGPGQIEYFAPNKDAANGFFPYGSATGPLVKDRLWLSASYSPLIYKTNRTIDYYDSASPSRNVLQSIDYDQTIRREFAFARIDAQPFRNLRANTRFLWNPIVQDGGLPAPEEGLAGIPQSGNGLSGAEFLSTRGGRANADLVGGSVFWTINNRFFVSGLAGRSFLNDKLDSYGIADQTRYLCSASGTPQNVPGSNCSPGFNTGPNSVKGIDASTRTSFAVEGGITGLGLLGRHLLRFGYEFDRIDRDRSDGYVDTGYIVLYYGIPISTLIGLTPTPGNLGSGFMQRFGYDLDVNGRQQALYGQTSWQVGERVTLDLGVRFSEEKVPAFVGADAIRFGWNSEPAPRVGIAYDPAGDGKTRIYAAFGRYFDSLKYLGSEETGGSLFARDYFEILPSRGAAYDSYAYSNILGTNAGAFTSECPIASPSGYSVCRLGLDFGLQPNPFPPPPLIDPFLRPTRQDVFEAGAERVLGYGLSVRGRYVHRDLKNVIEDMTWFNSQGSTSYTLTNPGRSFPCEATLDAGFECPEPKRTYDAVEIVFDRSPINRWFFSASYTWSRLRGNYSGLANSDELGRREPNVTRSFDTPSSGFTASGELDDGPLPLDRPHALKAFGGYTFGFRNDKDLRLTAFTTVQSGTPLTTFYTLYNQQYSVLFKRGDLGRAEVFSQTDFRAAYSMRFGEKYQLEISADILNLFDEANELARQTSISATNFTGTTLTAGGCTSCQFELAVYNQIFNGGGITQYVQNYLDARGTSSTGYRNDFDLPNRFQDPRSVRFGVRFVF